VLQNGNKIYIELFLYGVGSKRETLLPIKGIHHMYKLYKITNQINSKIYIGITKLLIEERWAKHLRDSASPLYPLHCAIQKYGAENFTIELLLESDIREDISSKEEPMIKFYQAHISQNGYNVAKGGYGGDLGPSANQKRRQTMLNKSDEEKSLWIAKRNVTIAGRTKENHIGKYNQSQKMIGNKFALGLIHSEENKKIISEANKGPKSEETKLKMSESAKKNNNSNRFSGRKTTCLCCKKEWDMGNYTQHIRKLQDELQ
jgi:group I intron endonuclease